MKDKSIGIVERLWNYHPLVLPLIMVILLVVGVTATIHLRDVLAVVGLGFLIFVIYLVVNFMLFLAKEKDD